MKTVKKPSQDPRLVAQCNNTLLPELNPMMPIKTLDILNRRRRGRNTQYYFTSRKHAVEGKPPDIPMRSFRMPKSGKLLSYLRYSDKKDKLLQKYLLKQPIYLKDNKRFAATRNISSRLYIEQPPDDVRAVVEIHPEFYNVIEGRPLRAMDDIKVYIKNIRNYAMNRQQIGYRRDMVLQIEKNINEEYRMHYTILDNLKEHVRDFQKFLTEDYKLAQNKVAKAAQVVQDLIAVNSELLATTSELTVLNNLIFKLDSIRNVLKVYRQYLIFVAPLSWRDQDERLRHSLQNMSDQFVTDNDDLIEFLDIDKIVELAKIELQKPNNAHMYFKYPEEMMYLFRTMEIQSREYLIQLSKTHGPYCMLRDRIKQLNKLASQELDYFRYNIACFENAIHRETFNENHLQRKFYRILDTYFFDSVASVDTLKLKICIEFVYEQIFGKCEEGYVNLKDPMKILEVTYEEINLSLDTLDFKIVNAARDDNFATDLKMMLNAYKAQRELKSFRDMTNSMKRAFLPPAKFKRPIVHRVSKKQLAEERAERKRQAIESGRIKPKYKLTAEEHDNLLMFSDWCEGTNPQPFLDDYEKYVKPLFE